jgi:arylsulfatase
LILHLQDNGACAENIGRNSGPGKKAGGLPPMPGPVDTWMGYGEAWANVSSTPFRLYKHFVHEGGIGTPLIAHRPRGIKRKGELEHQPGHLIDIMATAVDVADGVVSVQA